VNPSVRGRRRGTSALTVVVAVWMIGGLGLAAFAGWRAWREGSGGGAAAADEAREAMSPADRRQQEILQTNVNQPGDPILGARFQEINAKYFGAALPAMAVRWEPALAEVGALAQDGLTLEGMFGHVGSRRVILLNPALQADARAIDRALCHEMVHAHLHAIGDDSTRHGAAFQTVLARLAKAGAFEGIAAGDDERRNLRAWLDAESARLDDERRAVEGIGDEISRERAELDAAIAAFNARAQESGAAQSAADAGALEQRRQRFNERVISMNERLDRDRGDLEHFNREVARYNLMMAYPDGLDEESVVRVKTALPRAGG
jgi:hypothetical protein